MNSGTRLEQNSVEVEPGNSVPIIWNMDYFPFVGDEFELIEGNTLEQEKVDREFEETAQSVEDMLYYVSGEEIDPEHEITQLIWRDGDIDAFARHHNVILPPDPLSEEFAMYTSSKQFGIFLKRSTIETIGSSSPEELLVGANRGAMLTLIEEMSHVKRDRDNIRKTANPPHIEGRKQLAVVAELTAVLDKYRVMRFLIHHNLPDFTVTSNFLETMALENASMQGEHKGVASGKYSVGHGLGLAFVRYLDNAALYGVEADETVARFESLNDKDQLVFLISELGLQYEVHSEGEYREALQTLVDAGIDNPKSCIHNSGNYSHIQPPSPRRIKSSRWK